MTEANNTTVSQVTATPAATPSAPLAVQPSAQAEGGQARAEQRRAGHFDTKREAAREHRALRERCEEECRRNAQQKARAYAEAVRSQVRSPEQTVGITSTTPEQTVGITSTTPEQTVGAAKNVPPSSHVVTTLPHVSDHQPPLSASEISGQQTSKGEDLARELANQLYNERARAAIDAEIEKVRARFPEIKNTLDVVRLERYPEVKRMVARGYALSDAVRLAYEDVYVNSRTQAALKQARVTPDLSHIRPTSPTTAVAHEVTEEQIKVYLESVPGATREGAIRAYQKYKIG